MQEKLEKKLTSLFTCGPGQVITNIVENIGNIEHGPSNNDYIVDIFQENHHNRRVANSLKDWANLTNHIHTSRSEVLTYGYLQQKKRYATSKHGNEVGNQEGS